MLTVGQTRMTDRLVSLERTIDSLNGQLQEVRCELHQSKIQPLPVRFWRNLVGFKSGQEYMSAVCNRKVRPNRKVVSHDGSRA
ncbi:hypothetical protein ACO9S2_12655 [Nitrospira sp. NS4]|uniref:hypothetical protein n=1 Tax=Nitrospira sp. NS4 TaxID=3414498 RepID=UPI003C2FAA05